MKPYYDDGKGIVIYLGDCLEIIPELETCNLLFTSPPYNKNLKYSAYDDNRSDFEAWIGRVLEITFANLSDRARGYFVISEQMVFWMKQLAESKGWIYSQLLTWCKTNLVGGAGKRITGDWNCLSEWILLFRKGKRTAMLPDREGNTFNWFLESCPQSTFNGDHHRQHVAQMPLRLAQRIIRRTPGDLILEPFLGSGTTLLAAKQIGRRAIGIDVDEAACELAVKRLSQSVLPLEIVQESESDLALT